MTNSLSFRDISEGILSTEIDGNKTIEFSFASETPHRRMDWENWEIIDEVLDCQEKAIKGSRLQDGLIQFLWGHDPDAVRGVIKSISWENGKGRATAKMAKTPSAIELYQNITDEIIKGISVGYRVHKYEVIANAVWDGDKWESKLISPKKVRAIEWEIFEISATSIPADATVGIGRDDRPVPGNLPQLISAIGVDKLKKAINEMTTEKQDIRGAQEYQDLDAKYRESQAALTTHKADNEGLKAQVLELQTNLHKLNSDAEIGKKYATLKSEADSLVRETKMTGQEYDDLFAKSLEELCKDPDAQVELRAIEKIVAMAKKRSASLNTKGSKIPVELPTDDIKKSAGIGGKNPAILSYENAWKQ